LGRIGLGCWFSGEVNRERRQGAFAARGFTNKPTRPEIKKVDITQAGGATVFEPDGRLLVGEEHIFRASSPRAGYFHLFDLGSSGTCKKILPAPGYMDNTTRADQDFMLPPQSSDAAMEKWIGMKVSGPVTAEAGQLNHLLVIVTAEDLVLGVADLDGRLFLRPEGVSRSGAGFGSRVETGVSKLFQLPVGSWDYGLISFAIEGQ
jgi:hypothetical protein